MKLKTRRKIASALSHAGGIVMGVGIGATSLAAARCIAPKSQLGRLAIFEAVYCTGLIFAKPSIDYAIDKIYDWAYKDATMQEVHEVIVERTKET